MKARGRLLALWLVLVGSVQSVQAARQLTVRDGLSQNNVLTMARDGRGFMWFGTEDGLARFDGKEFKVYRAPGRSADGATAAPGPSSNEVAAVLADGEHLWVGTRGGGLDRFDLRHERWQRIAAPGSSAGLSSPVVTTLLRLPSGELLVGTDGGGLNRLRVAADGSAEVSHWARSADGKGLPGDRVWSLAPARDGAVWVGTRDGVALFDPATGHFQRFALPGSPEQDPFRQNADDLLEEPDGSLWIGTWERGLFRVDAQRRSAQQFLPDSAAGAGLRSARVVTLTRDKSGRVWFGTGAGLAWFEPAPGCACLRNMPLDLPGRDAGREIYVISLLPDGVGGLWAGTWGEGVLRLVPNALAITQVRHQATRSDSLTSERVRALLLDHAGDLWVGAFGSNLQRARTGQRPAMGPWSFETVRSPARAGNSGATRIWSLLEDRSGRLWVGHEAGLDRLDRARLDWSLFDMGSSPPGAASGPLPVTAAAIPSGAVRALLEDRAGQIWVGTSTGLAVIGTDDGVRHVPMPSTASDSVYARRVQSLAEDAQGRIWVGSSDGLKLLIEQSQWLPPLAGAAALPAGPVYNIRFPADGSAWLAGAFGICRSAHSAGVEEISWQCLQPREGGPAGAAYSLQPDQQGAMWAGTGHGLARVDLLQTGGATARLAALMHFEADGLVGDEYLPNARAGGPDGQLYFGSENGLVVFDPNQLRAPAQMHEVVLSAIELGNRVIAPGSADASGRVLLPQAPAYLDRLVLSHIDRLFVFRFSVLEFDRPAAIEFAYQLQGFDPGWVEAGGRALASYTNVPPGEYQLRARARDRLGTWGPPRQLLDVRIDPPFWATWWFRGTLLLATVLSAWLAYWLRIRQLRLRQVQLERRVEERTQELAQSAQALQDANLRLFELSTRDPLTQLFNRRHVFELLARRLAEVSEGVSVALVDADYFKRINDTHGHPAGDQVLRALAAELRAVCDPDDLVGRYGGEEFVCVRINQDPGAAFAWAEGLRSSVAALEIEAGAHVLRITISIGLVVCSRGSSLEQCIASADQALYQAKAQGRNRVVVHVPG